MPDLRGVLPALREGLPRGPAEHLRAAEGTASAVWTQLSAPLPIAHRVTRKARWMAARCGGQVTEAAPPCGMKKAGGLLPRPAVHGLVPFRHVRGEPAGSAPDRTFTRTGS